MKYPSTRHLTFHLLHQPFLCESAVCFLGVPLFMSSFQRSDSSYFSCMLLIFAYIFVCICICVFVTLISSKFPGDQLLPKQHLLHSHDSVPIQTATLQDKHTHTRAHGGFHFKQPSLIRNVGGNNVMSASIGHFSPTSKSHVGSNPHQSLADATMRAQQQWNNN